MYKVYCISDCLMKPCLVKPCLQTIKRQEQHGFFRYTTFNDRDDSFQGCHFRIETFAMESALAHVAQQSPEYYNARLLLSKSKLVSNGSSYFKGPMPAGLFGPTRWFMCEKLEYRSTDCLFKDNKRSCNCSIIFSANYFVKHRPNAPGVMFQIWRQGSLCKHVPTRLYHHCRVRERALLATAVHPATPTPTPAWRATTTSVIG